MLRLMEVREVRKDVYMVSLERDGNPLRYEFTWNPPPRPDLPETLDYPDQIQWDLMDYEVPDVTGQANGAIWIPVLHEVCQVVYRVADGHAIEFPMILDER